MNLYELSKNINNQEDFTYFLKKLREDLLGNREEWENVDLTSFINGMEGYCFDKKQEEVNWRIFADILMAARVYE